MEDALLLQRMATLTRQAGELIVSYHGQNPEMELKAGQSFNPVTAADKAADEFLKKGLMDLIPDCGWLSEETRDSAERLDKEQVWVVDPLDGTKRFLHWHTSGRNRSDAPDNRYQFAVSVALIRQQRPVLAALYAPLRNKLIIARADYGVKCNGELINHASSPSISLNDYTCLCSHTEHQDGLLDSLTPQIRIEPLGSAAYILALSGIQPRAVATSVKPKSAWDLAAADLIASELGQRVTDLSGAPLRYNVADNRINGYISAPAEIYAELKRLLPSAPLAEYE